MKKIIQLTVTLFFVLSNLQAQNQPAKIYLGMYVRSITLEERAKEKSDRFSVDAYWWIRYEIPKDTSLIKEIENIEFLNSEIRSNEIDDRNTFTDAKSQKKFGYLTGHLKSDFMFYPNYRYYPLDKLVLPITIESKNLMSDKYQLIADTMSYEMRPGEAMGVANDIEIPSFEITKSRYKSNQKIYETNFGDLRFKKHLKYSRLSFEIIIERKSSTFLLKILIPIVLITLMAYLVFFVPAKQLEVAVGLTVTSLLSCIALQLTIGSDIPVTGYLIASDKIFYLSYSLITYAMIQTLYTYRLEKAGKVRLANILETFSRWIYPIAFISIILMIIITGAYSQV